MKVEAILKSKGDRVVTVRPDAAVGAVAQRLKLERIGAAVVSADGRRVDGIVSERDIAYGLAERGAELLALKVADIMVHEVYVCTPQDSLRDLMAKMTHRRIRHVPVVQDGRLCGIVSVGDIVKNRLEELELETSVLRQAYIASH